MNKPPLSLTARSFLGNVWALTRPYWYSEERWVARGLLAAVVVLNLGLVYITVLLNKWYNDFYNSLQDKDATAFGHLLLVFGAMASVYIVLAVYQLNLNMLLQIRWRRWLTNVYFNEWLSDRVYYRMELKNYGTDNPDQRMQEDLKIFTSNTLSLGLGLLRSVVSLFSFVFILWTLSGPLSIPLDGLSLSIPGYMVWAALIYSILGTWLAHRIGKPLIGLNFDQQRYEADLRFALVRLRENAEGVALYRGEHDERRNLLNRFARVWRNWLSLIKYQKRLTGFTAFYDQLASIFPIVVAAPRYFSGAIQLGGLMQISSAFGRVQDALSWFISAYSQLAEWRATVDRLTSFHKGIMAAGEESRSAETISVVAGDGNRVDTNNLAIALPDRRPLLKSVQAVLDAGHNVIVIGPSGSGKSTLFRALAGIWPFGKGRIEIPGDAKVMFLPQKPYLPLGTLRQVVSYPAGDPAFSDAATTEALRLCRLENLTDRLHDRDNWALRLSPGEQQRLAIARALLNKPDWLFLDEATSALDDATEQYLYQLLQRYLPKTTLISIAHRPTVAAYHQRRLALVTAGGDTRIESSALN